METESKDGMERRGLGEIKVKGWNGKVIKAQKQKVVKMVYNSAKPYWFWQALPQVSKIITSSLQARNLLQ